MVGIVKSALLFFFFFCIMGACREAPGRHRTAPREMKPALLSTVQSMKQPPF